MNYQYNQVVLGGTFDLLHLGHQFMLKKAFEYGRFVTIGLTTDQFNKKRKKPSFQNQTKRAKKLRDYLQKNFPKRYQIILINDIFGTTLKDASLEAIVVSRANIKVVKLINRKREQKGLILLQTVVVPLLKDKGGKIISSTRIRDGQIDPLGRSYKKLLLKIAGEMLDDHIRAKLKKPLGRIVNVDTIHPDDNHIITVGDVTTKNIIKAGLKPTIAVVDTKVGRHVIPANAGIQLTTSDSELDPRLRGDDTVNILRIKNPPGQISRSLILAIERAFKKTLIHNSKFLPPKEGCVILIDGEEDLATIPAILLSHLGTRIYYGQPNTGLVEVKVDLKIKQYLIKLLKL